MNRKIAVFTAAAVLAGGAGIAVAAGGDSAATGSQPSMSRPGGPGGGPGGGRGFDLSSLAEALGVSESRLEEAMQAARPTDGQRPDASSMAAALAEELGLSAADVEAALEETMLSGGAPPNDGQGAPPAGDNSLS